MRSLLGLAVASCFASLSQSLNYTNPIIFADFPDNDVSRGPDGAYYFSGSSFSYSPGAPILRSHDLVNWELIGHSIPSLDFGSGYNMSSGNPDYVGGVWASSMRHRASNTNWYWVGCINFWISYVYTADNVTGPWTQSASFPGKCWYDCGLLIDDDDTMYVVYGNNNISISQLAPDGFSIVKDQFVFGGGNGAFATIEGNRLYKINGTYYVLDDSNSNPTLIWKSSGDVWGPWDYKYLQTNALTDFLTPGVPNQGSLVEDPSGNWHFISFLWNFPAGRIPIMAPITWGSDGYPSLVLQGGEWAPTYPYPATPVAVAPMTGTDTFRGSSLSPQWEWVLNPDPTKYTVNNGLTLHTAGITQDLYHAVNTLTHRTYGAKPVGTVQLDLTEMADGDRAGFAAFSYESAWVEVGRSGNSYYVAMVTDATQDPNSGFATSSNGTYVSKSVLCANSTSPRRVWLRGSLDTLPSSSKNATFSYSIDGHNFRGIGQPFTMSDSYVYFMGYRYAIFNFATKALGGSITVLSFTSA
jgi:beta-xylosidase